MNATESLRFEKTFGSDMKYIDKFPNMKYIDDIFDGMLRGQRPHPCIICGELTEFVEINYEAHFCSEECVAKMDERADALFREYLEDFDENKFEENPKR